MTLEQQVEFLTTQVVLLNKRINTCDMITGISDAVSSGTVTVTESQASLQSTILVTPLGSVCEFGVTRHNGSFTINCNVDGKIFMWQLINS